MKKKVNTNASSDENTDPEETTKEESSTTRNGKSKRLGKGLSALITKSQQTDDNLSYIENFDTEKLSPNPYQPRMNIDPDELIELADSIREHGIIEPLIITKSRKEKDKYYVIAGERRLKAAELAHLEHVPVVIKESSPQEMLELALIENIQREDLNPIEEANALDQLSTDFGLTHEEISEKIAKSRGYVTNKIRLLKLPGKIKEYILNRELSEGHARALVGVNDPSTMVATAQIVIKKEMNVRQTEKLVRKIKFGKQKRIDAVNMVSKENKELAEKFSKKIGYSVNLVRFHNGGKLVIKFSDPEEYHDLMEKLLEDAF